MIVNSEIANLAENTSSVYVPHCTVVDLYSGTNYTGKCARLWGGNHVYNLSNIAFPDGGTDDCVQVNPGTDITNQCRGSNNTGCWNDSASSVKVWATQC
jgi:hypothetical protein